MTAANGPEVDPIPAPAGPGETSSEESSTGESAAEESSTVDRVAAAVLAVPGVGGLHAGSFGEVGTYLPSRRVAGIRLGDDITEVHLAVVMGSSIGDVADRVVAAVRPLVSAPVQVFVEDVVSEADAAESRTA